jgi:hypothetical protein
LAIDARVEKAAAVARTLVDRDDLHRGHLAQVVQRQFERRVDDARYPQPVGARIDRGRDAAPVIAHEECVVRRDRPLAEDGERRLQLRRPAGQQQHRPLLREGDQLALAVLEAELDQLRRRRQRTQAV